MYNNYLAEIESEKRVNGRIVDCASFFRIVVASNDREAIRRARVKFNVTTANPYGEEIIVRVVAIYRKVG